MRVLRPPLSVRQWVELGESIYVNKTWNPTKPLLPFMSFVAGPPICELRPFGSSNVEAFNRFHDLLSQRAAGRQWGKSGVMMRDSDELHVVAVTIRESEGYDGEEIEKKVLWVFLCKQQAPLMFERLLKVDVMGVVLDLDEALVQSVTLMSLEERLKGVKERSHECRPNSDRAQALKTEEDWIHCDISTLTEFSHSMTASVRGKKLKPRNEASDDNASREVIRVPSGLSKIEGVGMVLTRYQPENPETSLIVHVRSGFDKLKSALTERNSSYRAQGSSVQTPPLFETYVCTTAQQEYAMEVTRVLDKDGKLFAPATRKERVRSVPNGLKRLPIEKDLPPELTVVVDDRTSVWEQSSRDKVLVVPPFQCYDPDGAPKEGGTLGEVAKELKAIRASFFRQLQEDHWAELQGLPSLAFLSEWPECPSIAAEVQRANDRLADWFGKDYRKDDDALSKHDHNEGPSLQNHAEVKEQQSLGVGAEGAQQHMGGETTAASPSSPSQPANNPARAYARPNRRKRPKPDS